MNVVRVKNTPRTTDERAPNNESWLDYWKRHCREAYRFNGRCCRFGCQNMAEHGAHVHFDEMGILYRTIKCIVPLCAECNNPNKTEAFSVPMDHLVRL